MDLGFTYMSGKGHFLSEDFKGHVCPLTVGGSNSTWSECMETQVRECKLHTDWIQTQDLIGVRQELSTVPPRHLIKTLWI